MQYTNDEMIRVNTPCPNGILKLLSIIIGSVTNAMLDKVILKHNCGKIERKIVNAFESVRSFENLKK